MNKAVEDILNKFSQCRALVIGDIMLDTYIHGKVDRISPEAPVPVVHAEKTEFRLGGAANVALNIRALGAQVTLCGLIGNDKPGETMLKLLNDEQIQTHLVLADPNRRTTEKTRIIGNRHQVLRIDYEDTFELNQDQESILIEKIASELGKYDVIIFEDYNKGLLSSHLIQSVISISKSQDIPVVVDPKLNHFFDYQGVTLFKPNRKEVIEGLKLHDNLKSLPQIENALHAIVEKLNCAWVMITLSEQGVVIGNKSSFFHFPAHERTIADVSGAGDTVIGVAALCLASGMNITEMAKLSNLAGGLVCEFPGVVPIDKIQLFREYAESIA